MISCKAREQTRPTRNVFSNFRTKLSSCSKWTKSLRMATRLWKRILSRCNCSSREARLSREAPMTLSETHIKEVLRWQSFNNNLLQKRNGSCFQSSSRSKNNAIRSFFCSRLALKENNRIRTHKTWLGSLKYLITLVQRIFSGKRSITSLSWHSF